MDTIRRSSEGVHASGYCYLALARAPAAVPFLFGRPGPAFSVRALRNSSVTATPCASAILAKDLMVRLSRRPRFAADAPGQIRVLEEKRSG